jgi:hypothetical protein
MRHAMTIFTAGLAVTFVLPLDAAVDPKVGSHGSYVGGVISSSDRLPPREGAYHGTSSHVFIGGDAILTCSSHGVFRSNDRPPRRRGDSVDIAYLATFEGELALAPPLVSELTVYPILDPIRMVERVTFTGRDRRTRVYDTELVALDFRGSSFPEDIIARVSTQRRTLGWTTITRLPRRRFLIETTYNVWMELSVDGGRTWHQQDRPVTMSLVQAR